MTFWPWWMGGLGLAGVVLLHWFTLGRLLAVSGRVTAVVDRLRFGAPLTTSDEVSEADMIAAIRAATAEAFGEDEIDPPEEVGSAPAREAEQQGRYEKPLAPELPPQAVNTHLTFLLSLGLGGFASAFLSQDGYHPIVSGLRSEIFPEIFGGSSWVGSGVLVVGGVLVGFGTRMSSGCTSGHGLCGVSRARPAGLLATACFFGTGIALSFVLGALS